MSKPRLLLADDSITIQKLINLTFVDEGFDVLTVGDGQSALREIGAVQPDIVLADVHMPGPDGYEICKLMRSVDETATIPVILLAGSFEPFDKELAADVGANSFVTKPFQSIRALVDEVNSLLTTATTAETIPVDELDTEEPVAEAVDISDIDSLYQRSLDETVEMPAEMATSLYTTDKLDDEMIETSYTSIHEVEPAEFNVTAMDDENFDIGQAPVIAEPVALDEPVQVEEVFEHVYDDLPDEVVTEDEPTISEMQAAPTEEFRHEMRDPFASTAQDFDLDEFDILDLSNAAPDQTFEFTTPAVAAEQGNKVQVVTLSPELMDIIVKKVVEKLSEKY